MKSHMKGKIIMLKTNSKEVKGKIEKYILNSFDNFVEENEIYINEDIKEVLRSYYNAKEENNEKKRKLFYNSIKEIILSEFLNIQCVGNRKKYNNYELINNSIRYYGNINKMFVEWCGGLPQILNCDFVYHCKAKEIIKEMLEETEEEADKYNEQQTQELLINLLFRELRTNVNFYELDYIKIWNYEE